MASLEASYTWNAIKTSAEFHGAPGYVQAGVSTSSGAYRGGCQSVISDPFSSPFNPPARRRPRRAGSQAGGRVV